MLKNYTLFIQIFKIKYKMGRIVITKTYDHNSGFNCCYRYWRAKDHRKKLHGGSLSFKIILETTSPTQELLDTLYEMNEITQWLKRTFSYTTCVAEDDPELKNFQLLHSTGVIDLKIMPHVGCDKFAEFIWHRIRGWLVDENLLELVNIKTVEVKEREVNGVLYIE